MNKIIYKIVFCVLFTVWVPEGFSHSNLIPGSQEFMTLDSMPRKDWEKSVPEEVRTAYNTPYRYETNLNTDKYLSAVIPPSSGGTQWILEFLSQFELVEVHYFSHAKNQWISSISGDQVPMNMRDLPHTYLVSPLDISSRHPTEIFIHLQDYQNKGTYLRLVSPKDFFLQAGRNHVYLSFSFSLILIIALYQFFLFLTGKKQFYLYYALIMISLVVALAGKHRILSFLFFPGRPYGYFFYLFFNSQAILFSLLFSKVFFQIPKKSPAYRILTVLISLFSLLIILSCCIPTPLLGDIMNTFIIPTLIFILFLIVRKSFRGDRTSLIVLISFLPLILGVLLENLLVYSGLFSLNYQGVLLIGAMLHALIMSYSLAMQQAKLDLRYNALRSTFHSRVKKSVSDRTRELQNSAYRDPLTGILNRACLEDKIKELEGSSPGNISILFADLDNFKYYNDNFGHPVGDDILCRFSRFLKEHLRSDDLIFRYGGDEFLVFMLNTESVQAKNLSHRLHQEFQIMAETICRDLHERECLLGLSLGYTLWSRNSPLKTAIDEADQALLKAKVRGKNRIVHSSDI